LIKSEPEANATQRKLRVHTSERRVRRDETDSKDFKVEIEFCPPGHVPEVEGGILQATSGS
jgi:hypothetical protein